MKKKRFTMRTVKTIFKKNRYQAFGSKGIFFILLVLSIVSGCDSDSETTTDEGLIIGRWEGYTQLVKMKDGTSRAIESPQCFGNILVFFDDGRLRYVDFVPESEDSCIEDVTTEPYGSWNRMATGKYEFILTDSVDGSNLVISPLSVTFYQEAEFMEVAFGELPENAPEGAEYVYVNYVRSVDE